MTLSMGQPAELQAWRLDPWTLAPARLVRGISGTRLSVSPDERQVAFAGRSLGPTQSSGLSASPPPRIVWTLPVGIDAAAPRALWQAPPGEDIVDVAWTPGRARVLVVTERELLGGARQSRLWAIDVDLSDASLLLTLPSSVVPGAYVWSPDGQRLAFIAHAGVLNALCVLEPDGALRYVADLESSDGLPLPYPAAAWSADGQRLLFVAPPQQPSTSRSSWFQAVPSRAAYVLAAGEPTPTLLAEIDATAPAWREDGQLLLVRPARDGGPLSLAALAPPSTSERLAELPLRSNAQYAGAWDPAHTALLLANRASGEVERWLLQLAPEEARP
jgi:dipeptidyl aminopeptidase/acylaminoacyl peptidase